jgi:hypothetical protein
MNYYMKNKMKKIIEENNDEEELIEENNEEIESSEDEIDYNMYNKNVDIEYNDFNIKKENNIKKKNNNKISLHEFIENNKEKIFISKRAEKLKTNNTRKFNPRLPPYLLVNI